MATPTYRARKDKELPKKISSPSLVDPSTVTIVGKVESDKGDSSDRGETPTKKKKSSHKSPKKPDMQSDLKSLDDKWSERFTRLEALFLSKTFQLPVEPVQSSNVVVSEKPFLPPSQQSSSHASTSGVAGKKKKEADQTITATQPVEAPGVTPATRPVEAPGAAGDFQPTSQPPAATLPSGRPEVQPPGPTVQPTSSATR